MLVLLKILSCNCIFYMNSTNSFPKNREKHLLISSKLLRSIRVVIRMEFYFSPLSINCFNFKCFKQWRLQTCESHYYESFFWKKISCTFLRPWFLLYLLDYMITVPSHTLHTIIPKQNKKSLGQSVPTLPPLLQCAVTYCYTLHYSHVVQQIIRKKFVFFFCGED